VHEGDSESEEWKLLNNSGKPIAMGTQPQMFAFVKHHVPDGRYRLVGPTMKVHMIRKKATLVPILMACALNRAGQS
jgi:hypothetical protein